MAVNVRRPPPSAKKRKPLAPKVARLLREAWWISAVGLALYMAMVLGSYSPSDPGWSHTGVNDLILNTGGAFGAWLSDFLLYLFGASAWWWVVLSIFLVWWGYHRIGEPNPEHSHGLLVTLGGFLVMLLASCGLESLRLHSLSISLPQDHGGVLGASLAALGQSVLGFDGSTVALLLLWGIGFSLFTSLSWITIAEKLGGLLETSFLALLNQWQARQDRKAGLQASTVRREALDKERKRREKVAPIHIEVPPQEIQKSKRAEQERQAFLFRDTPNTQLPPLHLLDEAVNQIAKIDEVGLETTSRLIERKLLEFGVEVSVLAAYPGPVVTRYEIEPASGVKGAQVTNLGKDLARSLSVVSIRVVETIPGKNCMALEIPNSQRQVVRLSEILGAKVYAEMSSPLTMALGKDISGNPVVADLGKMPHVLVAGTTGSGKSVAINAMILSLVYKATANEVRLILIDPKMLELSVYEGIPHLLSPVVTDMKLAGYALQWCVAEMDRRYKLMSTLGVRNIAGYNTKIREAKEKGTPIPHPFSLTPDTPEPLEALPLIVVVIDELADMMMVVGKKVEELIARLAQKARASGIHLVLATQRPSVDVITGLIKANVPTRVAFQVSSKIDSRTILDQQGAEALLGQGDMLYLPPGTGMPQRVHGAFVGDAEVHRVVEYLKKQGEPQYIEGILDSPEESLDGMVEGGGGSAESDPLYDQAVQVVLQNKRASISLVQRHLRIGYNRAARLLEDMEKAGLVSSMQSNGNREILAPNRDALQ